MILLKLKLIYLTLSGPFTTQPFKEVGFECPRLSYALRNPLQIAKYAYDIVQNRAENLLHGVLKSPIKVSRTTTNIPDGQVITMERNNLSCPNTIREALKEIPSQTFALVFIDNSNMPDPNIDDAIETAFLSREKPQILKGSDITSLPEPVLRIRLCLFMNCVFVKF